MSHLKRSLLIGSLLAGIGSAHTAQMSNGVTLNGLGINGGRLNALSMNGTDLNRLAFNGMRDEVRQPVNGISLRAVTIR